MTATSANGAEMAAGAARAVRILLRKAASKGVEVLPAAYA